MAGASDDIEVVRSLHEAMAEADFGRLFTYLDASVVITQDPALPWGGEWIGHDGFATFGLTLASHIESRVAIESLFAADGDVLQVGRTRGTVTANGNAFDIAEVHRWTLREGLAVRGHFSIDTPAMLQALG
jgi:ketosteroid isomerase-like protein